MSQYDDLAAKMVEIDMAIGSLANLKNPAITGFTGTKQAAAKAAVDVKLERYANRFEGQMRRLGIAINHICEMAGIAGVGVLVVPPAALEIRFAAINAYLTLIDLKGADLVGLLDTVTDHTANHLNEAGVKASAIFNEAVQMGYSADTFLDAWHTELGI